ncbi:hypothetical protein Tsubulata_043794 [Turnera subulata]|uniref:Uncharacterized protein n=1 Tax=Turnera subulata TaxID=218843 RepID=A0A9Q0F8F3_9ROSI|nr:hypothetical protein Tsubulata_043794 [Turnera subulata]
MSYQAAATKLISFEDQYLCTSSLVLGYGSSIRAFLDAHMLQYDKIFYSVIWKLGHARFTKFFYKRDGTFQVANIFVEHQSFYQQPVHGHSYCKLGSQSFDSFQQSPWLGKVAYKPILHEIPHTHSIIYGVFNQQVTILPNSFTFRLVLHYVELLQHILAQFASSTTLVLSLLRKSSTFTLWPTKSGTRFKVLEDYVKATTESHTQLRKEVGRINQTLKEVQGQLQTLSAETATWEDREQLYRSHPNLNLEDKVLSEEGSNVVNANTAGASRANTSAHNINTRDTSAHESSRRSTRARRPSRILKDYVLGNMTKVAASNGTLVQKGTI